MEAPHDQQTPATRLERLFKEHHGYLHRQQVVDAGIDPHLLSAWVEQGRAERVQRGVYRDATAPALTDETYVELALRIPKGVICLRSALSFHELSTIVPGEIDLAIPNKARTPPIYYPPVRFYYFTERVYHYGIEEHPAGPTALKVYSPEKTLADMLYYRNELGNDLFLEALQTYMRKSKPRPKPAEVMEAARVRRVHGQMRTYLEALI